MLSQSLFLVSLAVIFLQVEARVSAGINNNGDGGNNLEASRYETGPADNRYVVLKNLDEKQHLDVKPMASNVDVEHPMDLEHMANDTSSLIHNVVNKFTANVATHITNAFATKIHDVVGICQNVVDKGNNQTYLVEHVQKGINQVMSSVGHAAVKHSVLKFFSKYLEK